MKGRNVRKILVAAGALVLIAFTAFCLTTFFHLQTLKNGFTKGFDPVGTYQNIDQAGSNAIDFCIGPSEADEDQLIWSASDFSEGSGATEKLGEEGILQATEDPNGYRLLTLDGDRAATIRLSSSGAPESLILYLDYPDGGDLLKFSKVSDATMMDPSSK